MLQWMFGNELDNVIGGTGADEAILARDGNDTAYGRGGRDTLLGEEGRDRLEGGQGADWLLGGDGADTLQGDGSSIVFIRTEGPDTIDGQQGDDLIFGGARGDVISGGSGADTIYGEDGTDVLFGFVGDDRLAGNAGPDRLFGGEGRDAADYYDSPEGVVVDLAAGTATGSDAEGDSFDSIEDLIGGWGNDVLRGDAGDNRITTNQGDDTLTGGAGADTFSPGDGQWSSGMLITDFSPAEGDRLDLSGYWYRPREQMVERDGDLFLYLTDQVFFWPTVAVQLEGWTLAEFTGLGTSWKIPAPERDYIDDGWYPH